MLVFRLTRCQYADLTGAGGLLVDGRWHLLGRRVVYAAGSQALAVLERRVHLNDWPPDDCMLKVHIPNRKLIESVKGLPSGWVERRDWTQNYGDEWLREKRSLVLRVPSAIIPEESNFLINPEHGEFAQIAIRSKLRFELDERLFRSP